ncbi:MAG: hypothetical protein LBM23_09985 [Propionibacteriaceae bacterium]|jgi:hypothetical protein|nr:hypothetical protein [Propionibacteriaceae bacterium]
MALQARRRATNQARIRAALFDAAPLVVYIILAGLVVHVLFPAIAGPLPLAVEIVVGWLFIEVPIGIWVARQGIMAHTSLGKNREGLRIITVGSIVPPGRGRIIARVVASLLPWAVAHALIVIAIDPRYMAWWHWSVPCLGLIITLIVVSCLVPIARIDRRSVADLLAGTQVVAD